MGAIIQRKQKRPTLAILTYADKKRVFRGNQDNFVDLIRIGKERGVQVYVMTTSDFKLSGKHVPGYSYHPSTKSWTKQRMPLPHVVYNRIPYRKFELYPEVQQVIQTCLRHGQIHFFNPAFFNKWNLFEWINKSQKTRPFIPVTERLSSSTELHKMLLAYPFLYLKPIRGKAGKGIMRVSRISGGRSKGNSYELSIQNKTKSHISRYSTVSELWTEIQRQINSKEYIMQQGIVLSSYKQRPFDLRVLVQKNGKGRWTITGIGARLAGKSSITTHVPRGGSIDNPVKLLNSSFGTAGSKRIVREARKTALIIAKQIEKSYGYSLGEMSMDLGVDQIGHIWFFEANSKPMKFDEPPIRKKSLENLIDYSIYLCQRKPKRFFKKNSTMSAIKSIADESR